MLIAGRMVEMTEDTYFDLDRDERTWLGPLEPSYMEGWAQDGWDWTREDLETDHDEPEVWQARDLEDSCRS